MQQYVPGRTHLQSARLTSGQPAGGTSVQDSTVTRPIQDMGPRLLLLAPLAPQALLGTRGARAGDAQYRPPGTRGVGRGGQLLLAAKGAPPGDDGLSARVPARRGLLLCVRAPGPRSARGGRGAQGDELLSDEYPDQPEGCYRAVSDFENEYLLCCC